MEGLNVPWLETDGMEQRIRFVVQASQPDANVSALSRKFGISPKTGHKWLNRAAASGLEGLHELSRRPHQSPTRTPAELETAILKLRKRTGWGGRKIAHVLKRGLRPRTVDRVIKRNGLVRPERERHTATTRFEHDRPNALWQMDFKGQYQAIDGQVVPWDILDDHSRFLLSLRALHGTGAKPVWHCLRRCFEEYGLPDAILMDHGTPWFSVTNGLGLTWVSIALIKQGIRLCYSGIRHPQTQGKIERQHRSLDEWLRYRGIPNHFRDYQPLFDEYRAEYDYVRPHEALGMEVPATRYKPSPRPYMPRPPQWEYPPGADVLRLTGRGTLRLNGQLFFVCEALPHEWVLVERFGTRVLVTYRDMPIRELDLRTGQTRPVLTG